jgi:hypothetical protein
VVEIYLDFEMIKTDSRVARGQRVTDLNDYPPEKTTFFKRMHEWYPFSPNSFMTESALDSLISCSHVITLSSKRYRALLRPDGALEKEVATV